MNLNFCLSLFLNMILSINIHHYYKVRLSLLWRGLKRIRLVTTGGNGSFICFMVSAIRDYFDICQKNKNKN